MNKLRIARSTTIVVLLAASAAVGAQAQPVQLESVRLAPGERGEAWLEDRWHARFELSELEVRLPAGDGTLSGWDHTLRVALLTDDGQWTEVVEVDIGPESLPPPDTSPPAYDREVLDFLERMGLPLEHFEFYLGTPMAAMLPGAWQAQGVPREEIPDTILQLLEAGEDFSPPDDGQNDVADGGWSRSVESIVFRAPLPESVLARGGRFSLIGEASAGQAWRLILRGVPIAEETGWTRREWTYTHVW